MFLIGFFGSYFVLSLTQKPKTIDKTITASGTDEDIQAPFEPINNLESYNLALLGSGGEGHSGGTLTDSIIVVSINSKNNIVSLISIPRDLWVPGNRKINAEISANGFGGLKSTLQGITGLEVQNYISVDFTGLTRIIDDLRGIEVNIPKTFDDYFYPVKGRENETCGMSNEKIAEFHQKYSGFELEKQFTCRYETIHFEKGLTKITGEEALKLARSRHGDSDFGRSARQFAILKGVLGKLISTDALNNIDDIYKSMGKIVKTDIDLKTTKDLVKTFGDPNSYKITEIQLSTTNVLNEGKSSAGAYILFPKAGNFNFSEIKSYLAK